MNRFIPVLLLCMAGFLAHAQDVVPNPDFGNNGLIIKSPDKKGNIASEFARAVFELPDGKLLVAVEVWDELYLTRYFPNGTIDKSYGEEGYSAPLGCLDHRSFAQGMAVSSLRG